MYFILTLLLLQTSILDVSSSSLVQILRTRLYTILGLLWSWALESY